MGRFAEVCKRRGMKVKEGKNKVLLLVGEEGLECEVCVKGYMSWNLNTWDVFWMNYRWQSVVGRWQVGRGLQVLLGLWLMLGVCSLSDCWYLFLCMVVRQ